MPHELNQLKFVTAADEILWQLGYDSSQDPHMLKTPERFTTWLESFKRHEEDRGMELLSAIFDDEHDSLVQTGPIRFISMCAHHVLPVVGKAWVGYIPNQRVCGLSKMARVVDYYARQLTVQERVTQQIANCMEKGLDPLGVMVVVKANHDCMRLRGVEEPNAVTTTSAVRGVFMSEPAARHEFISLMEGVG